MSNTVAQVKLQDGTLIRHKVTGYEGRIEGTTEIKTCFTAGGVLLDKSNSKQMFQYRVAVKGESMRRIAPAEDFEILEGVVEIICPGCHFSFQTKPDFPNKPRGRCQCGEWICPSCLQCENAGPPAHCLRHQRRLARRLIVLQKRAKGF